MARKKTLNARRLTKREVQALIATGARPRPDLSAALEETFDTGYKDRPLVFELEGDRYLYVFDEQSQRSEERVTSIRPTYFFGL